MSTEAKREKRKQHTANRKRMEGSRSAIAAAAVIVVCFGLTAAEAVPVAFIRSSCKVTQYPDVCEKCLSGYTPPLRRSPRQLAHAALSVTAQRAVAASSFVQRMSAGGGKRSTARGGPREGGAVRDCSEMLADSVDRLRRSVKEMERMGRYGSSSFAWHLSNVQTWVSAALTNENTCLDGLSLDRSAAAVRPEIRRQIVHVLQLTSNALALINRLHPQK